MSDEDLPLPPESGGGFFPAPVSGIEAGASAEEPKSVSPTPTGPYRVLARKYRPRTLGDLIGQDTLVRILRRAFETGRVAHAFMLTGVRGVGKTTTARIIARALNCTGPDGNGGPTADPCGVCPNCVAILADRHPDVLEMDAASRTGVDDVREIIEASRFRPMQGRMKVFVIDEVHMLSRNAFNALLKTLEEPPAQVTFIFATTELRKVPVTVLSRCQRFDLQRVPQNLLAAYYGQIAEKEGVRFTPDALALIARAADGSVRDGLSLLDQAIAQGAEGSEAVGDMLGLADRGLVFDLLDAVMAGDGAKTLELTERAHARGADLGVLLADLMECVHLLSRLKALPALREGLSLPEMERVRGGALADRLSMSVLGRAWQILLKGVGEVEVAPDRRQAAEMVLIRLCHASLLPTPDKLIRQLEAHGERLGNAPAVPAMSTNPTASVSDSGRAESLAGTGVSAAGGSPQGSPSQGSPLRAAPSGGSPPRAALRLVANGGAFVEAEERRGYAEPLSALPEAEPLPEKRSAPALPTSWREMVALVKEEQEAWLHGILRFEAHLVQFALSQDAAEDKNADVNADVNIDVNARRKGALSEVALRIDDPVVRRRAFKTLSAMLDRLFPGQWRLTASEAPGEPTLDEQGAEIVALHRAQAGAHPLVEAILKTFPGAKIGEVRDRSLDDYGLPPEIPTQLGEDAPHLEFAPLDAESAQDDDFD